MWLDFIIGNEELGSMFRKVPELRGVLISEIHVCGDYTEVSFFLPEYAYDLGSEKGEYSKDIFIKLKITEIKGIYVEYKKSWHYVDIDIVQEEESVRLITKGDVDMDIVADRIELIKVSGSRRGL